MRCLIDIDGMMVKEQNKECGRLTEVSKLYSSLDGALDCRIISYYMWKRVRSFMKGSRVLLLGLGNGYLANELSREGRKVMVVEGSATIIEQFSPHFDNCEVVHSLFEEFDTKLKFDTVLGTYILEHVSKPIEILKLSKEWLESDGRAIFTVPNAESLHRRVGVELGLLISRYQLDDSDLSAGHRRVYDVNSLTTDLVAAGYIVKQIQGYLLKVVSNRQMETWDRKLLDAMYKVSLTLPVRMCSSLIALCMLDGA